MSVPTKRILGAAAALVAAAAGLALLSRRRRHKEEGEAQEKETKKKTKKDGEECVGAASDELALPATKLDGWFSEVNDQWPGQAMSLRVSKTLEDFRSEFQHVQVFETPAFGRTLVLDGVIQITERDECAYQEMMAHLPLFSHPCPRSVMVVGGGDGGVVREILRHPSVERVVMCEIDKAVVDVSKKHLPTISGGLSDPRVTVLYADAAKHLQEKANAGAYDVIVSDTSDPVGPAKMLFERSFMDSMYAALAPGGVVCMQGESMWVHQDLIKSVLINGRSCFGSQGSAEYATIQIPTYPCGQIGAIVCKKAGGGGEEKAAAPSCAEPLREPSEEQQRQLRYYSAAIHRAAFVMPMFMKRLVDGIGAEQKKK